MHAHALAITAWSNYYVIMGSAAASLTGLMFVVITLADSRRTNTTQAGIGIFSTPTVVHFCAALFVSAILTAPWRTPQPVAALVGLTGLFGVVYILRITVLTKRQTVYRPGMDDWFWYTVLPLVAYTALVTSAALLFGRHSGALFVLAGATLLLIFIGIHNAWDVVTYLTVSPKSDDGAGDSNLPETVADPQASTPPT